jgi:hypothetical protein
MKNAAFEITALVVASLAAAGCGKHAGLGLSQGDAGLGGASGQGGTAGSIQGGAGGAAPGSADGASTAPTDGAGNETTDVADALDSRDASSIDQGCYLLCPASTTTISPSGYVDLSTGDSAVADPDSLQITVCLENQCATLPRESQYDSQAVQATCGDASPCEAKVYGGNSGTGVMYAYVVLARTTGTLYSVNGSVMFSLDRSATHVAGSTRITIQSGGVTYLDASAGDCTLSMGCCGNLPYQQCNLSWSNGG